MDETVGRRKSRKKEIEILIVEDSPTQAKQLKFLLEEEGFRVLVAQNGKEALSLLERHRPALIVSDIVMPEMDGYQLCQQIKANKKFSDIPIILLTALSDPKDILKGLSSGADNFILKPYEGRYFLSRIQYILTNLELCKKQKTRLGVEIFFAGQKYFITSERQQILDLLLSTYETAVQKNDELVKVQGELKSLNEQLEERVRARTAALMEEINERKRLEEQLRLSQRMESIGRLAGGIAHDFNNLLTVIRGYTQLSRMELPEGVPLGENLEEIQKAADKASGLVRQLLAFSRRQVMEMKVLDLNYILTDLEKMLPRLIGEDIELVLVLGKNLGRVKADIGQIEQVIMNLAVNARDAMTEGGKLIIETDNVELDESYARQHMAVTPGRYVMISVSDTGAGMSPEVKEHAFEPFFTTKEKGRGTGLGLSTVYGIVKQSGGNIWIYSEPGKGTSVKIYLPHLEDPVEEMRERVVVMDEIPRGSETILVVEDEEEVRKLTVRILKQRGYRVLEASQGSDGVRICEKHEGPIHLLITDVVMPKVSGRELAKQILSHRPETKVVFMSGYTDNAILQMGMLVEEMEYIQKPFTVNGLARRVREVLDK